MRQPEDTKTIDLLEPFKRGRGRPRKENALTPAQRAKRYRDKQRALRAQGVTKNKVVTKNDSEMLVPVDQLIAEQGRSDILRACAELLIEYRVKKKAMPADIFARVVSTVASA